LEIQIIFCIYVKKHDLSDSGDWIYGLLGHLLLTGSEQIKLVCIFLPRCGAMLILVDALFVIRSCVQGMGKPMLPMISGILEMVLRILVISIFIGGLGFKAAAYAEIFAWGGALAVNIYAFFITLIPLLRKDKESTCCENKKLHHPAAI